MDWIASQISHEGVKWWLSIGWSLYVVVVSVWILLQRSAPVATLSWLLSMAALPGLGLAIYYFFGPQRLKRQRIKRLRSRKRSKVRASMQRLRDRMPEGDLRLHQVARLVAATSDFPVSSATRMRLLTGGAATFDAIAEAVRAARHHVHLEYYIYEPDRTGTALRDLLVEKARAGVAVRLLIDALGSKKLGRKFLQPLLDAGAQVARFHDTRIGRRLRPVINFRTHRKILVCDGLVGFTGGVNVTDEENERIRSDAYHDVHLHVEGPIVNWLQTVFMEDWAYALEKAPAQLATDVEVDALLPDMPDGDIPMQVITSGPDSGLHAIYRAHLAAINAAEQRIWLTTPYFVPTEAGLRAFVAQRANGVRVRIFTNSLEATDVVAVHAGYARWRKALLESGVVLYEMRRTAPPALGRQRRAGRFGSAASSLHAKTFVVDGERVFVGSFNFDPRSARLNTELGLVIDSPPLAQQIATAFREPIPANAYEVRLDAHGDLYWVEQRDGQELRYYHDPDTSFWQRAEVAFFSLLPIEGML